MKVVKLLIKTLFTQLLTNLVCNIITFDKFNVNFNLIKVTSNSLVKIQRFSTFGIQ